MNKSLGVSLVVLVLLAFGCGEEPTEAVAIVPTPTDESERAEPNDEPEVPDDSLNEPERIADTVDTEDTPDTPDTPPDPQDGEATVVPPLPTDGQTRVFVVPEGVDFVIAYVEDDELIDYEERGERTRGERTVSYPQFSLPAARTSRLLNRRVAAAAMHFDGHGQLYDEGQTTCEDTLATPHVVSIVCTTREYGERGEEEVRLNAKYFAIDGHGVRDLELADLLLPGADIDSIVGEACAQTAFGPPAFGRSRCGEPNLQRAVGLTEAGLTIRFAYGDQEEDAELSYGSLANRLLAAGPLAQSLDRRGVSTRVVDVADGVTGAGAAEGAGEGPVARRWVVTPMASLSDLAAEWGSLPEAQRNSLQIAGGYLVAASEAAARSVAQALSTTASEQEVAGEPQTLTAIRAARELPLLGSPDRDALPVRTLPRGTLLFTTEAAGEGRYLEVVLHAELTGFVDRRRISTEDVCLPDLAPFLEGLPESQRAVARTHTLRTALIQGGWGRATFIAAVGGTSHIELRRLGSPCTVDRSLLRYSREGTVTQLLTTRAERRAGETLVVTVTSAPDTVSVHRFGHEQPVFERVLQPGQAVDTSVREGEAWFPLVLGVEGEATRFTYGEGGLIEAPRVD